MPRIEAAQYHAWADYPHSRGYDPCRIHLAPLKQKRPSRYTLRTQHYTTAQGQTLCALTANRMKKPARTITRYPVGWLTGWQISPHDNRILLDQIELTLGGQTLRFTATAQDRQRDLAHYAAGQRRMRNFALIILTPCCLAFLAACFAWHAARRERRRKQFAAET